MSMVLNDQETEYKRNSLLQKEKARLEQRLDMGSTTGNLNINASYPGTYGDPINPNAVNTQPLSGSSQQNNNPNNGIPSGNSTNTGFKNAQNVQNDATVAMNSGIKASNKNITNSTDNNTQHFTDFKPTPTPTPTLTNNNKSDKEMIDNHRKILETQEEVNNIIDTENKLQEEDNHYIISEEENDIEQEYNELDPIINSNDKNHKKDTKFIMIIAFILILIIIMAIIKNIK
jgi:hypothetical protein